MTKEKIRDIGDEYKLDFWSAYYLMRNKAQVKHERSQKSFFHYLAMDDTPLFNHLIRHELVEDKSRIRDGKNYVVIGHQGVNGRVISWLRQSKEEDGYKLNLLDLLTQKEYILYNYAKQAAAAQYDNKLKKGWREEQLDLVYGAMVDRDNVLEAVNYKKPALQK